MAAATQNVLASILLLACLLFVQAQDDVREPPRIRNPSVAEEQFYDALQEVNLFCDATGNPPPTYEWQWNGAPLSPDSKVRFDAATGEMTIKELTTKEEGFYDCWARNRFPDVGEVVAVSPKIEVRVARIGPWKKSPPEEIEAVEGSPLSIECEKELPVFYGRTTFKWYSADSDKQLDEVEQSKRIFIDNKGSLHFAYLMREDELSSEQFYACAMSNAIEGKIDLGGQKRVVVKKGAIREREPVLEFSTRKSGSEALTFMRGETARLECFFSGYDRSMPDIVPTITWYDNAGPNASPISNNDRYTIENNDRVLLVHNLRESDEHDFKCVGSNSKGQKYEENMLLNVTSAPIWKEPLQSVVVPEGEDAHFSCVASSAIGEHAPDPPRWRKNGAPFKFDKDDDKYKFLDGARKLVIKSVLKGEDIACYQCSVGNSEGEVTSDGCLNVILGITILQEPEEEQVVNRGDIVNLTVVAESDRLVKLNYRWIFHNKTFEGADAPPFVQYDHNTMEAFINTTGMTDSELLAIRGVYYREVFNPYQKKVIPVTVTLKDAPVVIPVAEAGFDYWIIGLIIGILLIIIVIILICCVVCRRKMLEGDYPVDRKETAAGLDPEKELKDSGFHDLSRADYDFLPEKKHPNMDFDDPIPLGDDDSFGSEYGDEATAFNEDGSFIGQYAKDKKSGGPPGYQPAESNV